MYTIKQEYLFLRVHSKLINIEEMMELRNCYLIFILLIVSEKKNHHNLKLVGKQCDEKQNICKLSPSDSYQLLW